MFHKPFVVKSNTSMKSSARRKLLASLKSSERLSSKAQVAQAVLTCASGDVVYVYTFDKIPYFFMAGDGIVFPTVYYTWTSPDFCPTLYVAEQVFSFLENGADLMLPGVLRKPGTLPEFKSGSAVAISVITKEGLIRGPLAIGISLMSSMEMIAHGMQGRGVRIIHLYKDYLWEFGPRSHPPSKSTEIRVNQPLNEDDFPPLGSSTSVKVSNNEDQTVCCASGELNYVEEQALENEGEVSQNGEEQNAGDIVVIETAETLLLRCFLAALKYRVEKTILPLDLGEFYLKYLLACVPPGKRIEMKKTKYKKFSVFLKEVNTMENCSIIKLDDKKKGAETIVEINYSHPLLKNFEPTDEVTEGQRIAAKPQTKVEDFYATTEPVMAVFRSVANVKKGDLFRVAEVRQMIMEYAKMKGLNDKNGKVSLNDPLFSSLISHSEETIKWDVLMQKALGKMTRTFVVTALDGTVLKHKLKLPEITFKVESRSGNKKVTLLNNVAAFGIEAKSLCQKIQIGVATTAFIVNEAPQCEGPQIIVQGNQIRFLSNLLMEEYGIDKKFMSGLALAPKKK